MRAYGCGRGLVASLVVALTGCTTLVKFEPEPPTVVGELRLTGRVEYNGNPEYLPGTLVVVEPSSDSSTPVFVYRHDVRYRLSSVAAIWNPLLLFGFRGVGIDVTASGLLEIKKNDRVVKRYDATCVVRMRRSIWVWGAPSQSELRREGLLAVRKMIEAQMTQDRELLEDLLVRAHQARWTSAWEDYDEQTTSENGSTALPRARLRR